MVRSQPVPSFPSPIPEFKMLTPDPKSMSHTAAEGSGGPAGSNIGMMSPSRHPLVERAMLAVEDLLQGRAVRGGLNKRVMLFLTLLS